MLPFDMPIARLENKPMNVSLNTSAPPPTDHDSAQTTHVATTQNAPTQKPVVDTVQISSSAQAAAKAALEESTETVTQTKQEASHGDHQAQRLLANETQAAPNKG
jgi:hypothetical protein